MSDYTLKQLGRQGVEGSVRSVAPTIYCSKLGSSSLLSVMLEDNAVKKKKKEKTPNKKSSTGQGQKACLLISTSNFGKYLFFTFFLKSLFCL